MKKKRKIYFMMYHRKQTALFSPVIEKLLGAISVVLQMISTKKKKQKQKQTCSKSVFFLFVCFYSTIVPLNVFRVSSSWLSLLLLFSYSTTVFYNITNIILLNLENWIYWIQLNLALIIWYSVFTPLCYNSYYASNGNMLFFAFYIDFYIFYDFSMWCI